MLRNSKILFEIYIKFKMYRSHLLYITVAVVVYIGESSQYRSFSLIWTIPRYRRLSYF